MKALSPGIGWTNQPVLLAALRFLRPFKGAYGHPRDVALNC